VKIDIHRLPIGYPQLYIEHSRLADARHPMGATFTHIYRAKAWRSIDARHGVPGYARRQRIRTRLSMRPPFVYVPNVIEQKTSSAAGYHPSSHRGRAA